MTAVTADFAAAAPSFLGVGGGGGGGHAHQSCETRSNIYWDKDPSRQPTAKEVVDDLQKMESLYGTHFEWTWCAAHMVQPTRSPSMELLYNISQR